MIRKYHNHKLQINPWHLETELHNKHETQGGQTKQSNQLSLPHRDDCKTRVRSNAQVTHSRITSPVPLRVKSHGWSWKCQFSQSGTDTQRCGYGF